MQSADVIEAMAESSGVRVKSLAVDGGASVNNFLMQFQSDVLGIRVERPTTLETTALGAAFLAGLSSGVWADMKELSLLRRIDRVFNPRMTKATRLELRFEWKMAVSRARGWAEPRVTSSSHSGTRAFGPNHNLRG